MITLKGIINHISDYSLWKTLYFNFKCFPYPIARKLPVYIGRNVVLARLDGQCSIESSPIRHGMIRIGCRDMAIQDLNAIKTIFDIRRGGITFRGKALIGGGTKFYIKGRLTIGKDVYISLNSTIIAHESIIIGDETTIGWDTLLMDSDMHKVVSIETGEEYPMTQPIEIGKHCWICNGAHIMKGSIIPDDVIVASESLVNKKMDVPSYSMIAGVPAELKKKNIKHIR